MNNEIIITNNDPQDLSIVQNENQTILINGGGDIIGITDVKVNGTSVVSGNIAYIIVPTKLSQLENDEHFITTETDPTVPSVVKQITLADINNWNSKQDELISGSNIKTINNISLLGNGNINVGGVNYTAGTGIDITEDVISNTITSYDDLTDLPTIPTQTSDLLNDSDFVVSSQLADVAFTGDYDDLNNLPSIPQNTSDLYNDSGFVDSAELTTLLAGKQNTLISGTNIKTINGVSILGAGDIVVTGGGSTDVQINGNSITNNGIANIITESAYNSSTNKIATKSDIPTTTSQLTNNSNFAVTSSDNSFSGTQTFNNISINGNITSSKLVQIYSSGTTTSTATINLPAGIYLVAGYVQAGGAALLPGTTMIMVASGGGVASDIITSGNFTISIDSSNNCNITATYGNVINYSIVKLM